MVRVAKKQQSEQDEFLNKVTAFLRLKKSVADLTKEANALRDEIARAVDADGEEDDTGSRWVHLPEEIEGAVALKRERRVSRSLDSDAADEILERRGLKARCYDLMPVLNEDEIMACIAEELLTEDDVEQMFPSKVTWATVTQKK